MEIDSVTTGMPDSETDHSTERGEFATLTNQFAAFARDFMGSIAGQLCAAVDVGQIAARRGSWSELARPSFAEHYAVAIECDSGQQKVCLVLGRQLAGWAADLLLGAHPAFAGRSREFLTDIDRLSIDTLMSEVPDQLRRAFPTFSRTSIRLVGAGAPSAAHTADGDAVIMTAALIFGETRSSLTLLLPHGLATASDSAPPGPAGNESLAGERIRDVLASVIVEVDAVLKGSDMRLRDVVRLRPGMVLALPQKVNDPVECQVNGVTKFKGEMTRLDAGSGLVIQSAISSARWDPGPGRQASPER